MRKKIIGIISAFVLALVIMSFNSNVKALLYPNYIDNVMNGYVYYEGDPIEKEQLKIHIIKMYSQFASEQELHTISNEDFEREREVVNAYANEISNHDLGKEMDTTTFYNYVNRIAYAANYRAQHSEEIGKTAVSDTFTFDSWKSNLNAFLTDEKKAISPETLVKKEMSYLESEKTKAIELQEQYEEGKRSKGFGDNLELITPLKTYIDKLNGAITNKNKAANNNNNDNYEEPEPVTHITDPTTNPDAYNPFNTEYNTNSNKLVSKGNIILGVLNVIGTIVAVLVISVIGIKYMVGSVEERAEYKKTMIPYLVGAILLFSSTTVVNIIYNAIININQ